MLHSACASKLAVWSVAEAAAVAVATGSATPRACANVSQLRCDCWAAQQTCCNKRATPNPTRNATTKVRKVWLRGRSHLPSGADSVPPQRPEVMRQAWLRGVQDPTNDAHLARRVCASCANPYHPRFSPPSHQPACYYFLCIYYHF